ncbi:MAG: hypothetical protein Q7I99_08145 [Acholeplasmataceae bacterium]|nr:hypothetical protein [Acholeplasmataceae bacterium]
MKKGDLIQEILLKKGINTIHLDRIYPIESFKSKNHNIVTYMIDDQIMKDDIQYANKMMIDAKQEEKLSIYCGSGYLAVKDDEMNQKFLKFSEWSGGDGIYTFNLSSGKDVFDQKQDMKTLFVFGDTFVGTSDPKTNRRYQPHLMPNNSIGIYQNNQIEFKVNWQKDGSVSGFYKMDPRFDQAGTVISNTVYYDRKEKNIGYLSGINPKSLEIVYDLRKERFVSHIDFYNYFSQEANHLAKRGLKNFMILGSNDDENYVEIKSVSLEMAKSQDYREKININVSYRYFKLIVPTTKGIGNYNDESFKEGMYGLNLIKFFNDQQQYKDIFASANSVLLSDDEHSWIWLQDGVIINDYLYTLPMTINSDLNQPEGLQFCVKGVAMIKTPIINQMIDYEHATMKMTSLLIDTKDSQFLFGAAVLPNTVQAGAKYPDGYIYIYGYKTTFGLRELVVARVLAENFEFVDDWRFFDGNDWVTSISESKPILEHISCEMSVSQLLDGLCKDKYIAVFTYDTNTPYVAFAIGDSPVGPFGSPQKIYHTPEQELYKSTTYTYNAKAHPHLSKSTDILVTYNTNTYNFEHNMSNNLIYRPRFIHLIDTTK